MIHLYDTNARDSLCGTAAHGLTHRWRGYMEWAEYAEKRNTYCTDCTSRAALLSLADTDLDGSKVTFSWVCHFCKKTSPAPRCTHCYAVTP